MKNKNRTYLYKIVLLALFSALAFVGTMIHIPLPTGGMIHLGNFVIIISALLCGGLIGGLSGGIGCGIYEIVMGSQPASCIQYFVLKFCMGFIVGILFRLLLNHKSKVKAPAILIVSGTLLALMTTLAIILYNNKYINLSSSITNKEAYMIMVYVFGYLFSIILIATGILSRRLKIALQYASAAISVSIIVNILLEFVTKLIIYSTINGLEGDALLIKGISVLPGCIFTGTVTLILGVLVYTPLYKATKQINGLNSVILTEEEI